MPYDDEFEPAGKPSDELIGPPDPISSALGHLVLVYGKLDAYVSAVLLRLLEGDEAWGRLLTVALSWEEKLTLLDSALAASTLKHIIRLHHPFSRREATRCRQSAWAEAGVLFEWIYQLVALEEDLQAFFDGAGPDMP